MARPSLQTASAYCLALWVVIWILFLLMRFSPLDIRGIPGIGAVVLISFLIAMVAPMLAMGLAAAALFRQPRTPLNLLTFGCAMAAFFGQGFLFLITRWL